MDIEKKLSEDASEFEQKQIFIDLFVIKKIFECKLYL